MHLKTPLMNSSNCKYLPIYIIRINLHDNKEKIKDFYKNNEIAILVNQDNEKNIGIIYTKVIMLQRRQKTFNLSSDGKKWRKFYKLLIF